MSIQTVDEVVKEHVSKAMRMYRGDRREASKALGVSVRSLYRYEERWGKEFWK